MREEIRALSNLESSIIIDKKSKNCKCELLSADSMPAHQPTCRHSLYLVLVLQNNAKLTDALGLESFDLLPNFRSEGCRDGSGVDLGSAHGCLMGDFWLVVSRLKDF